MFKYYRVLVVFLLLNFAFGANAQGSMSHQAMIDAALSRDPLLMAMRAQDKAAQLRGQSQQQWADPSLSFSADNVPLRDSMLHQEGMTQLKLSLAQTLPRGDSLALEADIFNLEASQHQLQGQLRQLTLRRDVGNHWLKLHDAMTRLQLVNKSQHLLAQLVEVAKVKYGAGQGDFQAVIQAQVEQSRLALRINTIEGEVAILKAQFGQWLPMTAVAADIVEQHLPAFNASKNITALAASTLVKKLLSHPQIRLAQQAMMMGDKKTDLAKQALKPQYTLYGSYGLRSHNTIGEGRADLFSVGVKLSLPLFWHGKQHDTVAAATLQTAAKRSEKQWLLEQMSASYWSYQAGLNRLSAQLSIYQQSLMVRLAQQSEASLQAYNNDSGDFRTVLNAYVAQLNADIELAQIKNHLLQQLSHIQFLLPTRAMLFIQGADNE